MLLVDLLRESLDTATLECWQRERTTNALTGVAVVNEGPDGEPVVVPITRFSLRGNIENSDHDFVWELVGEAVDAVQAPFDDVFVRYYDIQFTFDGVR